MVRDPDNQLADAYKGSQSWRAAGGRVPATKCADPSCGKVAVQSGYCSQHYREYLNDLE